MIIQLNVGGRIFCTSEATLTKVRDSYFEVLLRGNWQPDVDGAYFLDLDPTYFEHILNHLRCDAPLLAGLAPHEVVHVSRQLEFLQLPLPVPLDRMWAPTDVSTKLVHTNFCQTVAVSIKSVQRSVLALVPSDRFAVRIDVMVCSIAVGFTTKDAFGATEPMYANAAVITYPGRGGPPNPKSIVAQYDRDTQKITFDVDGKRSDRPTLALPPTAELFPFVSFYDMHYPEHNSAYQGQVTLVPLPSS